MSQEIVDPTNSTRDFQEQLKTGLAQRVKAKENFVEKWETSDDKIYYLAFTLARVPKKSIETAFQETVDNNIKKLQEEKDKAQEAKAKKQFDNALNAFKEMKDSGFLE